MLVADVSSKKNQTAPERLATRDEIRRHAEVLDPPHLPGATEPGLALVRDEEPAVLIRELAKAKREILGGDPDARLKGHRLEDCPRDPIRGGDVPEDLVLEESE